MSSPEQQINKPTKETKHHITLKISHRSPTINNAYQKKQLIARKKDTKSNNPNAPQMNYTEKKGEKEKR